MEETEVKPPLGAPKKKEKKPDPKTQKSLDELIEIGIPLAMVVFNKAVRSNRDTVEFAFYWQGTDDKIIKPRQAKIWFTPHGVVVEQMGKYKVIPLSNVYDTNVL